MARDRRVTVSQRTCVTLVVFHVEWKGERGRSSALRGTDIAHVAAAWQENLSGTLTLLTTCNHID